MLQLHGDIEIKEIEKHMVCKISEIKIIFGITIFIFFLLCLTHRAQSF